MIISMKKDALHKEVIEGHIEEDILAGAHRTG